MMEELGLVSLIAFFLLQIFLTFVGLDLKKPRNWLFGALGFLCGLAAGTIIGATNLLESIGIGVIAGFLTLLTGALTRKRKIAYGGPRWIRLL